MITRRQLFADILGLTAGPSWCQPQETLAAADVIVVGAGLAGLSAAVSAREAGARRVLILEKDVMIGGHSIMSSGYFNAVDPKRQKPLGITDSPALMEKQSLQVGGDTASPILMRQLAESSSEVLQWLEAHGVHWSDQVFESYSSFQRRGHISSPVRAGYDYVMALLECARRLDVKILLGHRAERLITENGHIVGAAGVCRGCQAFEARAHAVILATGGFAANTALLENALGPYAATLRSSANTRGILTDGAAGDGILMASAVGAKIVNMDSVLLVPYNGGRVTGYVGGDIYLTKEGRRFIDEGASWLALRKALQNLPDGKMWVLTDSGTVKNNDFSLKLMTGAVREAATLDEAAKGIGCNPAILEETVRQYNHSVHIGRDEAFGKTTMLKALDEPPFYYGEERLNIHSTEGGVAIDTQARVLDQSEEPLLGLFAAGETVGNLHGKSRPGGNGVLACVVFGRIAGQEAARLSLSSH